MHTPAPLLEWLTAPPPKCPLRCWSACERWQEAMLRAWVQLHRSYVLPPPQQQQPAHSCVVTLAECAATHRLRQARYLRTGVDCDHGWRLVLISALAWSALLHTPVGSTLVQTQSAHARGEFSLIWKALEPAT